MKTQFDPIIERVGKERMGKEWKEKWERKKVSRDVERCDEVVAAMVVVDLCQESEKHPITSGESKCDSKQTKK